LKRTQAATLMGMRSDKFDSYVAGRHFPPLEKLQQVARFFGTTPESLSAPSFQLDTAAICRRISHRLKTKQMPVWKAAMQIHLARAKLERILAGDELPSGPQLHLIAKSLGTTPEALLGIDPLASTPSPAAATESEQLKAAGHVADAKLPLAA
jgi:hypothetical protein